MEPGGVPGSFFVMTKSEKMLSPDTAAHKPARMEHHFLFMRKFFRHGVRISSIWPSSRSMSRACISRVNWNTARVVVELGAGTGAITREILRRVQPHTFFLTIERDADFVSVLQDQFTQSKNFRILHGDVSDLVAILREHNIPESGVDGFISGLGTPSLPENVKTSMFAAVRHYLNPTSYFSNITEVPWYFQRYYRGIFKNVSFQLVPINVPPGGIYHCREPL
ncbi:MAG TPA: rRNA adenine N-6-methyltransferase family protein [Phycisphaerae bacterium]|nr:rRNA adenine N-6-methyltransferase family protein [Phycisphaerae bacterium]